MTTKTKIYSAEYNSCIYESSYATISLHRTYQGACQVIRNDEARVLNQWLELGYATIPDYEKWRVREIELEE